MRKKLFFGFTVLFSLASISLCAQDELQDLSWYTSFSESELHNVGDKLTRNEKLIEAAATAHDTLQLARLHKEQAMHYLFHARNMDKAMEHFYNALACEERQSLTSNEVFTYLGIAKVFTEVTDYDYATQSLNRALEQNEKHKDYNILFFILNQKGNVGILKGDTAAALIDFKQALEVKEQLDDMEMEADALSGIAQLLRLQGQYNQSLTYFKQALTIRRAFNNKREEARILNDVGELYMMMKNDARALANHEAALSIRQTLYENQGMAQSLNNIGEIYYRQKKYQTAAESLLKGLNAARESQDQNMVRKSFEFLSYCYKETGDLRKALYYNEELIKITDFIQRERDAQMLTGIEALYQAQKHKAEVDNLERIKRDRESQLKAAARFRNVLLIGAGLVLIIALLVFNQYRAKRTANKKLQRVNETIQQQNEQLHELNATKDKFFSIISHDLKGPLNSLTSFSGLLINHADNLSKEEIQMLAQDLDKSLKNLFALLENLLEWSRSQTGALEFTPEVFNLTEVLQQNMELLSTQAAQKKIQIVNQVQASYIVNANKNSVTTVFRNLISNAIKFTPSDGVITIDAQIRNGELITSIHDTGVGMSKEVQQKLFRLDTKHTTKGTANEKGTGLGLILCKDFVEKNGGRIWVESEQGKGSVFHVALPLNNKPQT